MVPISAAGRSREGAKNAGIAIEWRPPGQPRFGGHIERLIGTQMGRLHLLPGTTFSNEQELGDYNSKRHAALTLRGARALHRTRHCRLLSPVDP